MDTVGCRLREHNTRVDTKKIPKNSKTSRVSTVGTGEKSEKSCTLLEGADGVLLFYEFLKNSFYVAECLPHSCSLFTHTTLLTAYLFIFKGLFHVHRCSACMHIDALHVSLLPTDMRHLYLGTGVTGGCKSPCGCLLGTERGFSVRATLTLNYQAISSPTLLFFFKVSH